jgi:hypothetical protein
MDARKIILVGVSIVLWLARTADMVFAQGLVNFNNRVTSSSPTVDAPISLYCPNGPRISGEDPLWRAALLGGPTSATATSSVTEGTLQMLASPITGATWVTFRTGAAAGYLAVGSDGARDSGLPYGSYGMFQLVFWHGTDTTWHDARTDWVHGQSLAYYTAPFTLQVGFSPANLAGLQAFYVPYWDNGPTPELWSGPFTTPILALPGSTVTLHYEVLSPLQVTYFWYFNDVPLTTDGTATLTLTNVNIANEGVYTFLASNVCGTSYAPVAATPLAIKKVILKTGTLTGPGFSLVATGTTRTAFQIEASTNLKDWGVIGVYSNASGAVPITNVNVTGVSARFYRAVLQ